jgi:CubicO group peptidase (beta-lactamase class C family)
MSTRLAAALVLGAVTAGAQSPATTALAGDSVVLRALDDSVPTWLARHHVPSIAIAWVDDGGVRWTRVYGEQSAGVPAAERTLYNVASLTKPVFAETIVRLAAAGRLALDEPMSGHWVDPDVAGDPRHRALTPRLALSHRTGFPNWRSGTGQLRFRFDPGTSYEYSGEGFEYLRRFAERKLGASLDSLARRTVFEPFGMGSAAFVRQPWFEGHVAAPARADGSFYAPRFSPEGNAADLLYATVGDYARFVVGAMRRDGLPAALASQRDSIHWVDAKELAACRARLGAQCPDRIGHALGWQVFEYPGFTVRWHTGSDDGHKAVALYFPELRRGAVMLTNGANGFLPIIQVGALLTAGTPFAEYVRRGGG